MRAHVTKRYPTPKTQQAQAAALAFGGFGVCYLVFIAVMLLIGTDRPSAASLVGFALPGAALIALGVFIHRLKRDWLTVNLETRVASCVAGGALKWSAPIDEFGVLAIVKVQRQVVEDGQSQLRTDYEVLAGGRDVVIHSTSTYLPARRFAVTTAKLWGIGLAPLDGRIRAVAELDTPLWQLPARFAQAAADSPQPSSMTMEETSDATTIRPIDRRWGREAAIRIDAHVVSYRGRNVPTADVVEIANAEEILVVGRNGHVSIPTDFVDVREHGALVATLRSVIVQYGARRHELRATSG